MPLLRPNTVCRLRLTSSLTSCKASTSAIRTLTTTPSILASTPAGTSTFDHDAHHDAHHGHESHYDPPSGWLWGVKPGEKYEKEGWEGIWYWGFFGSLGVGIVAWAFKPDSSIQTWALEEARRRLEVEGILKEPESKS